MTKKTTSQPGRSLLDRFDRLDEQVPVDDQEADQIIADLGIDVDASLHRLMVRVNEAEAQLRQEEYAEVASKRQVALTKLQQSRPPRTRAALLARIAELQSGPSRPQAFYKNLESVPDDDLASLVAELEELSADNE